ncbi:hypothetical protein ACN27F_05340 [Solwaraspora sp. WMMB335]|uniref:hypothetical protein n=1 Tax=Solwaraspora sp. WMMB335 TaxID=3404118 RepID=UPI003B94170B
MAAEIANVAYLALGQHDRAEAVRQLIEQGGAVRHDWPGADLIRQLRQQSESHRYDLTDTTEFATGNSHIDAWFRVTTDDVVFARTLLNRSSDAGWWSRRSSPPSTTCATWPTISPANVC